MYLGPYIWANLEKEPYYRLGDDQYLCPHLTWKDPETGLERQWCFLPHFTDFSMHYTGQPSMFYP